MAGKGRRQVMSYEGEAPLTPSAPISPSSVLTHREAMALARAPVSIRAGALHPERVYMVLQSDLPDGQALVCCLTGEPGHRAWSYKCVRNVASSTRALPAEEGRRWLEAWCARHLCSPDRYVLVRRMASRIAE